MSAAAVASNVVAKVTAASQKLMANPRFAFLVATVRAYWFTALLVIAALWLINFIWKVIRPDAKNAPPRFHYFSNLRKGVYQFGTQGPMGLIRAGYEKHGELFRIRVAHQPITVLVGLEPQVLFFEAQDEELNQAEVYKFTIPVFGRGIVYDAPQKIMTQQLKFLSKGLMFSSLKAHCAKIVSEAETFFAKWGDSGQVDLMHSLSDLTIMTASRCLLGREIRENVQEEFGRLYQELSDGMSHLSVLLPRAPTTAHRKRDAARKKIAAIFSKVIRQRRASKNATNEDDFLQTLIDSKYKDGRALTEEEIIGLLLAGLFAGQHTSNITGTWTGFLALSKRQELLPRILQEQKDVLEKHGGELTLDALNEMELLHHCVMEALRLYPPLIVLARKVLVDMKYKDYVIPKGDIVAVAPPVSHRLPDVFKNPLEYDPDRFAAPRNEDESGKWAFIAFGGGKHACLGRRFALLQIKTIWSVLFRKFHIELVSPMPKPDFSAIVVGPHHPCVVSYKRKAPADEFKPFL